MKKFKPDYKKISDVAVKVRDWFGNVWYGGMDRGRRVSEANAARIRKIATDETTVRWGFGGPKYDSMWRRIDMPKSAHTLDTPNLYALSHELIHARQHSDGRLILRKWGTTPTCDIDVNRAVLREEWEACTGGWKLTLDEDMFHPMMIVYGIWSWLSYLTSYVAGWAYKRWEVEDIKQRERGNERRN